MRDYACISPKFWIGNTGRSLRGDQVTQVVALYLITCQSANMIGLYYLPIQTLSHEIGVSEKQAWSAIAKLSKLEFALYDKTTEHVYLPEMARWQIGETMKENDARVKRIAKLLRTSSAPESFIADFIKKYKKPFKLPLEGALKSENNLQPPPQGGLKQ